MGYKKKMKKKECTYCKHEAKWRIEPHDEMGIMWLYLCDLDKWSLLEVDPMAINYTFPINQDDKGNEVESDIDFENPK